MERLNKFSRLINKVYYNLFVELDKKKKITFNFSEEKRWDLLNQIIKIKKIENYLEIGCDNNDLFERINRLFHRFNRIHNFYFQLFH